MSAIKTAGLDHIELQVADAARSVAWYESVLGCRVERLLPSLGLVQMRAGASLIDLVDIDGPAGRAGGAAAGSKRRNMDHFCVQFAEFDGRRIAPYLKRKGLQQGKVERRYGALGHGPSIYLTDPDGNSVEFKGPPDADQTEQAPGSIWPAHRRTERPT